MLLNLKNVYYQTNSKIILQDVNLKINQGDWITLIGPSGSGKSTILKLIANLISPSRGTIFYQDKDISSIAPAVYRRQVSYCFQQPTLFGKTVEDNLTFPFELRKQEVDSQKIRQMLSLVDLDASYLTKKKSELSGGEKQRVALIRNLLFKPKILLLDEVTAGLDEDSKHIVNKLISSYFKRNVTILEVTHDKSEISQAQHIVKLEKDGSLK
ncbi:putative ABC transport system ATP-binding protein [Lactobacillus colini]|uniref:ABC transport system ATP-binding protein n=2 Tax=Lactobacillus colini TaxID=1819254 RepID=A0ABS4ME60_9LACO|nr:ATP-binding cassette domain-containing protein [Lactobacillus colini]MBP2057662.1 putative ABC transport system ATP-binding protein [Lactobacillus colini]